MREMSKSSVRGLTSVLGAMATFATLLAVAPAKAQMCETDADCGFGFSCHQQVVSHTSATGGVGTATSTVGTTGGSPECGNAFCEETESVETCPDDCQLIGYCVGASCETDAECAEDYGCQPAGGVYSTTTTGGGVPLCGDGACDVSEDAETCAIDCSTERTCQVKRCETDADCDEGFYCDPKGGVAVASASASVGGGPGSSGTIELYQSQCLPYDGGSGGGASTDAGESVATASVGGPSSTNTSGAVATVGGPTNTSGSGGGHTGSSGHHWPWPRGPRHPGCSVHSAPAGGALPLAGLVGLIGWAQLRRRRRSGS